MFRLKNNVDTRLLTPQTLLAIIIAEDCYASFSPDDFVITSLFDGKHMLNSKHYEGNAFDLRKAVNFFDWQWNNETIVERIQNALGRDFDVVLESNHIHIEYDPKGHVSAAKAAT